MPPKRPMIRELSTLGLGGVDPFDVAVLELSRMRPRLIAKLNIVTEGQRQSIQRLIELEEAQLRAGNCDHTRNEELLEQYRQIRARLVAAIENPEPKDAEARARAFDKNLDCMLAVYLTYIMRLAAEYDPPEEPPYAGHWRSTLTAHGQDLCELVSLAFEDVSLQEPHYRRDPRATGYFKA
jgi:hypothetical protein